MKRRTIQFLSVLVIMVTPVCMAQGISNDLKEMIQNYKVERATIKNELLARLKERPDATRAEKNRIVVQWRNQNQQRIIQQRRLAEEIHGTLLEDMELRFKKAKELPPEEGQTMIEQWFKENSRYFSYSEKLNSLELAKGEFIRRAKSKAKDFQANAKNNKEAKSNNGRGNSDDKGNQNRGKGNDKGKGLSMPLVSSDRR